MNMGLRSVTFLSIPVPSPGVILGLHGLSYPPDALVHTFVSFSLYSKAFVPLRWYRRWIGSVGWQWLLFPPLFQPYHTGSFPRPLLNLPWDLLKENSSDCDPIHTRMSAAPGSSLSHPGFRNSLKISSWIFSLAYMNLETSFFASTCLSPYFRVVVHPEISILSWVQIALISTCQVFFFPCCLWQSFQHSSFPNWRNKSFL